MNQLKVFKNGIFEVGAVLENGQVLFDVEQVARSLGFIDRKNDVEYVRWNRVNSHLPETSPRVAKGDLIPEPLVYKLAFKAQNNVAEKFQDWLAVEVIPSIRKDGGYIMVSENDDDESIMAKAVLIANKTIARKNKEIEDQKKIIAEQKPKVLFAESVEASKTSILVRELAVLLKQNGIDTGERRLYEWLRSNGYLVKRLGSDRNTPTQRSMDMGLFEIKETPIHHNSGSISVSKTTKVTGKGQVYFINKLLSLKNAI
ncbi:phage antirepressor KilAC domain-containing protein [Sporosarcina sp. FSL K6-3508]|uniref:phage antirepressor KilAC domain-containing protein n=1 Tax=Sporosarcina sp. FSL K6-3508 TaxID=2921557 RepID=UPI00315B355B